MDWFDLDNDIFDGIEETELVFEKEETTEFQYGLSLISECEKYFYSVAPKYFKARHVFARVTEKWEAHLVAMFGNQQQINDNWLNMAIFSEFLLDVLFNSYDEQFTYTTNYGDWRREKEHKIGMDNFRLAVNALRNKLLNIEG
jgi:hypothetical protein